MDAAAIDIADLKVISLPLSMPHISGDVDTVEPAPYIASVGKAGTRFALLWRARGTGKRIPSHNRVRHAQEGYLNARIWCDREEGFRYDQ